MNQDRKTIIVNEILYWRENKLLPEAYCNFLISLYTEGEGIKPNKLATSTKKTFISLLAIGFILPFLLLVTYFTEISTILQMVIHIIFIIVCILGLVLNRKNPLILHIGSIVLALFILLLSVKVCEILFKGQEIYVSAIIFLNCVGWIIFGVLFKKKTFLITGILGIITACFILLNF